MKTRRIIGAILSLFLFLSVFVGAGPFSLTARAEDEIPYTYTETAQGMKLLKYTGTGPTAVIPEEIDGKPVTIIGDSLFYFHRELTSITIPDSVKIIESDAFQGCSSLTSIVIPYGVESIKRFTFAECTSLSSVTIPDSVSRISNFAFGECRSLTSITIPDRVTSIRMFTFYGTKLASVTIPNNVDRICGWAFAQIDTLTSITIPASVREIDNYAFSHCSGLSEITFAGSAPRFRDEGQFSGVTATVHYPADDPTWTESVRQDYGGSLTWVPYGDLPEITEQPSDASVTEGGEVAFAVTSPGAGLTYQWQYSKDDGAAWTDCSAAGHDSATFSFTAKASMNGRLYRCKVTNSVGSVTSDSARLTVNCALPEITSHPADATVPACTAVQFTAAARGTGLAYQWQYSKNNGKTWIDCTSSGHDQAAFSFTATASMNGRLYRCRVTNSAGSVTSNSAKLTISDVKPAITGQPSAQSVTAGKTAEFAVAAAGSGLNYRWYYSKDGGTTWTKCTSAGSDTATFSFTARASMNGRLYRCKVTNSYGSVTSSAAKLTVK